MVNNILPSAVACICSVNIEAICISIWVCGTLDPVTAWLDGLYGKSAVVYTWTLLVMSVCGSKGDNYTDMTCICLSLNLSDSSD